MRYASALLVQHLLNGEQFLMADLITITLQGGQVYRWTNGDRDVIFNGATYVAVGEQGSQPIVSRGAIRIAKGMEVDTLDLTVYSGDTATLLGINLPLACHNGALDGAKIRIERLFQPTWGDTSLGTICLFEGNVASVEPGSTTTLIHAKSDLERLSIPMPRVLIQPGCANAFGDAGCGIDLVALTYTGYAGAGSSSSAVVVVNGQVDGYYTNGVIRMTGGAAAGQSRTVASYVGGYVTPAIPFSQPVGPGDTYSITPGCPRTVAGCQQWSNTSRFRGCPWVPAPETVR